MFKLWLWLTILLWLWSTIMVSLTQLCTNRMKALGAVLEPDVEQVLEGYLRQDEADGVLEAYLKFLEDLKPYLKLNAAKRLVVKYDNKIFQS